MYLEQCSIVYLLSLGIYKHIICSMILFNTNEKMKKSHTSAVSISNRTSMQTTVEILIINTCAGVLE